MSGACATTTTWPAGARPATSSSPSPRSSPPARIFPPESPTGGPPIFSPETFAQFCRQVEAQSPRALRRFLDYGKRLESGQGLGEFHRWLGRILLDDTQVYTLEDWALAFEIAACERLAGQWEELEAATPALVAFTGPADKATLYRQILAEGSGLERRAAFLKVLESRYKKSWEWIRQRAGTQAQGGNAAGDRLLEEFLARLEAIAPLAPEGIPGSQAQALEQLQQETRAREAALGELRQDLEFAEDRARRAHQKLRQLEEEAKQLRRQLREARENGEKLREERSRRIQLDRQAAEATGELERLRQECVRLDRRLRQMAQRLAQAEGHRQEAQAASRIEVPQLRRLDVQQILGVEGPLSEEELSQVRRRFAAALHSDRVGQLPAWVGELFDEILSAVNEACDRMKK